MSNPFLFNNFGGTSFQQQNYQNNQQNQGWNQNITPSTTSTFQSQTPQMDFFDMTTPQSNQPSVNNKPLGANDFRSLMNSPSNNSTTQFVQPNQPPPNLNQLRSMFTREDEPIIAPITPQVNQPPPSTSTYSPSFTFMPETVNQNQPVFQQNQPHQSGQASIDFSKYDPLAGEIINSNKAKQNASNKNAQVTGNFPDNNEVPMVFYGADTTSMGNMPSNFPTFDAGQTSTSINMNQNQAQQQTNFFDMQQSNPTANVFGQQVQQQPNANFFNIQETPQQSQPASNIFNSQTNPETNIFNNQSDQQLTQPAHQQQQNTEFFNIQEPQQSPQTAAFSGSQSQPQQDADLFALPKASITNGSENPFLTPTLIQTPQSNSTDTSNLASTIPNSPDNISAPNEKQASSNPSIFDMFRVSDNQQSHQQQQQASNPPISPPSILNQQNSPLDDIFGNVVQQKPPQQQQQQQDVFDPFGRNKNASQQQSQKATVSSENPFVSDNTFQLDISAPKSEPQFASIEDSYNPFGKPSADKENPFSENENLSQQNSQNSEPTTAKEPELATKTQNDFNSLSKPAEPPNNNNINNNQDNPFVGFTPTNSNPFLPGSSASQDKPNNSQPQNDAQQPFDPFGRNSKSSVEPKKEDGNKSNISYMRSLFASNADDLFSKPNEQQPVTNNNDSTLISESKKEDQNQQPQQAEVIKSSNDEQQKQQELPNDNQQNAAPAFDPFGVGSALPMVEGASFTFSFDEQDKNESEAKNVEDTQKVSVNDISDEKSDTASPAANNFESSPFSPFGFSQPVQQQPQQQPQIVDDLFFDFTSIPAPKSDNLNDKTASSNETQNTAIDITIPTPPTSTSTSLQKQENDSNQAEFDENIRPGTDESSMSISADYVEGNEETQSGATVAQNEAQKEANQSGVKKDNETEPRIQLNSKSSSGVGFYSDGVNTFTFDADKERLTGPNPFEMSSGQAAAKFNPFVKNTAQQQQQQQNATPANENSQKFNPFTSPLQTQSTQKQEEPNKNAPSADVFKTAQQQQQQNATPASENSQKFSPFTSPSQTQSTQKQEEPKKNAPSTDVFKTAAPKELVAVSSSTSDASFNPFGRPQPQPETAKDDKKQADSASASPFTPFGQPQVKTDDKDKTQEQAADVTFNPFGQDFSQKANESNISSENSFTFKIRSNQTPEIDENDFLPVQNNNTEPQTEAEPASSDTKQQQQQQEPEQSFSPFGVFNQPQQQQQQPPQPFGFGSFTSPPFQQHQEPATQSSQSQQQQQQQAAQSNKASSSSTSPFAVRRPSTNSATYPFSLLIASLTPFTENYDTSDEADEADSHTQVGGGQQHGQSKSHEEATGEGEQQSNPFTPWKPTELDSALGECEEPSELDAVFMMRFKEKVPPLPPFVAFEQSMATRILNEYCTQLSESGSSLEHINELLGIQDMARISIEEFSA